MLIDRYKDKYNELNLKRENLAEKRRSYDVKAMIAKSGKREDKFNGALVCGATTYLALLGGLMVAGENFVTAVPSVVSTSAILGASVLNGFAVSDFLNKRSKTTKQREEMFDGDGQRYFMEQEALATIESDRCSNRIKVLNLVRERLENEIHKLETINDNFVVFSEDDDVSTEAVAMRIEKNVELLIGAYNNLDCVSAKKTLSVNFCDVYNKADMATMLVSCCSAGGLTGLIGTFFPENIYTDFYGITTNDSANVALAKTIAPVVLGGGLALGYGIKKLIDERAVLKRVNKDVFGKRKIDFSDATREELTTELNDAIYSAADLEYDLLISVCKFKEKFPEDGLKVFKKTQENIG